MKRKDSIEYALRRAIKADRRSVRRLALDAGISDSQLGRFLHRQRDLTVKSADKLCRALGLALVYKPSNEKE